MFTGSAETPNVMDMSTSNKRPPMRIENATQRGLKHPCHEKNCQYLYCGNAVIDIIRMIVLHPDGAKLFIKHQEAENGMFYHIF